MNLQYDIVFTFFYIGLLSKNCLKYGGKYSFNFNSIEILCLRKNWGIPLFNLNRMNIRHIAVIKNLIACHSNCFGVFTYDLHFVSTHANYKTFLFELVWVCGSRQITTQDVNCKINPSLISFLLYFLQVSRSHTFLYHS